MPVAGGPAGCWPLGARRKAPNPSSDWWQGNGAEVTRRGTLVLAPARDRADLDRFARMTQTHRSLDGDEIAALEPELQGRFPIRVELQPLSVGDFEAILTQTHASLVRQYQALLATERVLLDFQPDGINRLASIAFEVNERTETIGARRLSTVMERLLDDVSFDAARHEGQSVRIDRAYVDARLEALSQNEDLSRFIL
jgi:ATP-dependent protease Clp ATPase subunit